MPGIDPEQSSTYYLPTHEGLGDASGPNFYYPDDPNAIPSETTETGIIADIPDVAIDQTLARAQATEGTYRLLPVAPALGATLLLSTLSWMGYGGLSDRAQNLADEAFATARIEISRLERIEAEIQVPEGVYPEPYREYLVDEAASERLSAFLHNTEGAALSASAYVNDFIPIGSAIILAVTAVEATKKRRYVFNP